MTGWDPLDRERVRVAAEDHAGGYGAGPLRIGRDTVCRWVAVDHLGPLVDRYGLDAVCRAVARVVDSRPALLTDDNQVRAARRAARAARCEQHAQQAYELWQGGDDDRALQVMARGELVDPDHRFGSAKVGWDALRQIITG